MMGHDLGRGHDKARIEAHRQYIDIQFVISGHEEMGWMPIAACRSVDVPYTAPEREVMLFADRPETWFVRQAWTVSRSFIPKTPTRRWPDQAKFAKRL